VSVLMTLSDLERQGMRGPFSGRSPSVCLYCLTKSDQTQHGNSMEDHVSGASAAPVPMRQPQRSHF